MSWKPPPLKIYEPELVAQVRELYESGHTVPEVSALTGTSVKVLRRLMPRHGIARRRPGPTPRARAPRRTQRRGLDLSGLDDARFRQRFWSKVDTSGDCWVWTRYCQDSGYGQFTVRKGDFRGAHVVAYALTNGPVPPGAVVCHHCDNPPCVRPDHLFLGTGSDNARDMFAKGRQGSRHPGSERRNAVLTEDDARAIRAAPGYWGCLPDLAREYGVSTTTIRKIRAGQDWKHVA